MSLILISLFQFTSSHSFSSVFLKICFYSSVERMLLKFMTFYQIKTLVSLLSTTTWTMDIEHICNVDANSFVESHFCLNDSLTSQITHKYIFTWFMFIRSPTLVVRPENIKNKTNIEYPVTELLTTDYMNWFTYITIGIFIGILNRWESSTQHSVDCRLLNSKHWFFFPSSFRILEIHFFNKVLCWIWIIQIFLELNKYLNLNILKMAKLGLLFVAVFCIVQVSSDFNEKKYIFYVSIYFRLWFEDFFFFNTNWRMDVNWLSVNLKRQARN